MNSYHHDYQASLDQPEQFWLAQARRLDWFQFPTRGLALDEKGFHRWFPDGQLNTCHLALDVHVANGRADQPALIYDSPVTGRKASFTYAQLLDAVARFAGGLASLGLQKGDRVVIYMPMVPESAIAMLACARLGLIHSVVFGGFAAHELAIRIDDAQPKALLTASGGIEITKKIEYGPIVAKALAEAHHHPDHVVMLARPEIPFASQPASWLDWNDLANSEPAACVPVLATDPLYILYTSGTTGKPKGIIRDHGGHAVALRYSMEVIYDTQPGDVFWAASDVGWVVGHSYIVYAPLLTGCTTLLFEGKPVKTPDPGTFWRIIEEYKVNVLFTAPTAIRAIKKEDAGGQHLSRRDLSSLRYLFLAGERCDVATYEWASDLLKVPVVDHWWQTESGWPMIANLAGYGLVPTKPGSVSFPVPGFDVRILAPDGSECEANEEGAVVIRLPLPPSCLPTLWGNDDRFRAGYLERFPGYYLAGDGGFKDDDGYFYLTGRIDDVINVAGHRLSTAEMEEVLAAHPAVAECAVIGIADTLKGQVPVGLVILKEGHTLSPHELEVELVRNVRDNVGAVASFRRALVVERLPKTRSGKILRKIMRAIADKQPFAMPSTIDDPSILDEIRETFLREGVGE